MTQLLYRLYQIIICVPVVLVATVLTAVVTVVGCAIGDGHFWGYYPGKWWSKLIIRILLLPVKVEGRENLVERESYVFVANHQGAFDVFLIYGFLCRNFKWMMKKELRRVPFVGRACQAAHHIYVDHSGPGTVRRSMVQAREILSKGMSLVVFPEGSRTHDGNMQRFKRGAFMLADKLRLPVVPITINGSYNVMPRWRDLHFVVWHPLRLTIHTPIYPPTDPTISSDDNIERLSELSRKAIASALDHE